MPRPNEGIRDLPLVGVRVSPEAARIFDVARSAYGHRSRQDLLRPILEEYALRLLEVPEIAAMVRNAAELRARQEGTLSRLQWPGEKSS